MTLVAALTLVPAIVSLLGTRRVLAVEDVAGRSRRPPGSPPSASSLGRRPAGSPPRRAASWPCWRCSRSGSTHLRPRRLGASEDAESTVALETLAEGPARRRRPTRRACCLTLRPTATPLDERRRSRRTPRRWARPRAWRRSRRPTPNDGRRRRRLQRRARRRTRPPTRRSTNVKGPIRDRPRTTAAPDGTEALVGGMTSIFVDFQDAMNRDYSVVFPVAALMIMLILALLLRSLVAPLYLMASVGLGFGATLGATVLVFQHIKGDDGPDLHAADLHLSVRGGARHRLQHPDDRPTARGGPRGPRARATPRPRRSSTPARPWPRPASSWPAPSRR